jgi:hypothetical protein
MNTNASSLQDSEEYIPLPQHLTKYCVMTIHFMLLSAIISFALGYKMLSLLFVGLYILGFTYWCKPKYNSIFKKIDIFLVFVTISLLFYYALQFKEKYQRLFIITLLIIIVIAIINETLYRFKIVGVFDNDKDEPLCKNFSYFTLDYTSPFTSERENCCRFAVFVHCFFCHMLTNLAWLYCLVGNTYF